MKLIYITCKDTEEAEKISKHLLRKRLIACANIFPIKSMYLWEGKITDDNEVVLLAKGMDYENIKKEVKKIHSYKIPCILKINVDGNSEYLNWVSNICKE